MGSVALPLYSKINMALCGCSLFRHGKALETPRLLSREVLARARREAQTDLFCVFLHVLAAWQGVRVPAIIQLLEPAVGIRSHLKAIESHQRCQ